MSARLYDGRPVKLGRVARCISGGGATYALYAYTSAYIYTVYYPIHHNHVIPHTAPPPPAPLHVVINAVDVV